MSDSTAKEGGTSLWLDAWLRLRRNKLAVACLGVLVFIALLCWVGPWFTGWTETLQDRDLGAQGPSWAHWMGTDYLGRDLMTRVFFGGRISLAVGLLATLVSLVIGVTYGAVAGYAGGRVDAAMMRLVDILYGLPFIIFVILIIVTVEPLLASIAVKHPAWSFLGSPQAKLGILFLVIGAFEWLTMARIVRAQVMSLKKQEFIEAARSLGLSRSRIIFRHLIPNVLGPVIVYTTLTVPSNMLLEAVLSFLGLGVQPPFSSWGILILEGARQMEALPWLLIFPALFFSLTLFSLNFLGDGLRDALDPKSSKD